MVENKVEVKATVKYELTDECMAKLARMIAIEAGNLFRGDRHVED